MTGIIFAGIGRHHPDRLEGIAGMRVSTDSLGPGGQELAVPDRVRVSTDLLAFTGGLTFEPNPIPTQRGAVVSWR